jgi:hypothetical protein
MKGLRFLANLKANELACHCLMKAGEKHGSETKNCRTAWHGCQHIHLSSSRRTLYGGSLGGHMQRVALQERILEFWLSRPFITGSKKARPLHQREALDFPSLLAV